jgi:hypothetical protein
VVEAREVEAASRVAEAASRVAVVSKVDPEAARGKGA